MAFDLTHRHSANRQFFGIPALLASLGLLASVLAQPVAAQSVSDVVLNVYKSESCGCCVGWIQHMEQHRYRTNTFHPEDLNAVKAELGIKPEWASCHTAITADGYLFEGHIPEKFISAFLANPPEDALGLTVPGMPIGGPGMEMGDRFTPYEVLVMYKNGSSSVYASIESAAEQY